MNCIFTIKGDEERKISIAMHIKSVQPVQRTDNSGSEIIREKHIDTQHT